MLDLPEVEIALKKAAIRAVYGSREDRSGRFLRTSSPVMTSIEYDKGQGALTIAFASGKTRRFLDVPEHVYLGLIQADSKSVFFYDHIRDTFVSVEQF